MPEAGLACQEWTNQTKSLLEVNPADEPFGAILFRLLRSLNHACGEREMYTVRTGARLTRHRAPTVTRKTERLSAYIFPPISEQRLVVQPSAWEQPSELKSDFLERKGKGLPGGARTWIQKRHTRCGVSTAS